ncbi:MAG: zf-HC2 domain-containing protein [Micropruina glycogenica]
MTDESHDLIGAYALDALDAAERAAFEQHLAECEACQVELIGLRETLDDLADDTAVEPPPALRDAVLGAVAALLPPPKRVAARPMTTPLPSPERVLCRAQQPWTRRRAAPSSNTIGSPIPRTKSSPAVDEAELRLVRAWRRRGGADEAIPSNP